jgi:hypothetical protein
VNKCGAWLDQIRISWLIEFSHDLDPDLPVIALQSGGPKSRKWPFRDSRRAIFRGAETTTDASASV